MAKITRIANEMAEKFFTEKNRNYGLNKVMYEMNYLVYSGTKLPLSYKDKAAIVMHLFDIAAGRKKIRLNEGEEFVPDIVDVVMFFERRNSIFKHLKSGARVQAMLN